MRRAALVTFALLTFAFAATAQDDPRPRRGGIFSAPEMALPPALESGETEVFEGAAVRTLRNPFRFGRYEVKSLKRGNLPSSQHGLTIGNLTAGSASARERYSFELRDQGSPVARAECFWLAGSRGITHQTQKSTTDLRLRQDVALRCSIDAGTTWTLELTTSVAPRAGAPDVQSEGFLEGDRGSFDLEESYRLSGTRLLAGEPVGYLFTDGDQPVAAMERIGRGRLILARDLRDEERVAIATAGAALFLQEQLADVIEE